MTVLCFKGVSSYGENTLRHIHDGGEGGHGEEEEGSRCHHHVTSIQDDRHGEQDIGKQPAAECSPVKVPFCFSAISFFFEQVSAGVFFQQLDTVSHV